MRELEAKQQVIRRLAEKGKRGRTRFISAEGCYSAVVADAPGLRVKFVAKARHVTCMCRASTQHAYDIQMHMRIPFHARIAHAHCTCTPCAHRTHAMRTPHACQATAALDQMAELKLKLKLRSVRPSDRQIVR